MRAARTKGKFLYVYDFKAQARCKVRYALKTGQLVKGPCEECGRLDRVEAHHEDYEKPLEVRWFCQVHHKQLHAGG